VHLGGDVVVDTSEVVVVLDLARLPRPPGTGALVARATAAAADPEGAALARTLVVTTRGLHLSPLVPETVARRVAHPAGTRRGPTAEM
jgi:hypothetical protein